MAEIPLFPQPNGAAHKWWVLELRFERPLKKKEIRFLSDVFRAAEYPSQRHVGVDGAVLGQWYNSFPGGGDAAVVLDAVRTVGANAQVRAAPYGRDCPTHPGCAAGIGFDRIERPFRAPHHTVSLAGLCGGGGAIHELQLAHEGMLFLDAVDQFKQATLQALRDALKHGVGGPWLVLSGGEAPPGSPEQIRQNQALGALGVASTAVRIPLKRRPNDPRAWPSTATLRARIQAAE